MDNETVAYTIEWNHVILRKIDGTGDHHRELSRLQKYRVISLTCGNHEACFNDQERGPEGTKGRVTDQIIQLAHKESQRSHQSVEFKALIIIKLCYDPTPNLTLIAPNEWNCSKAQINLLYANNTPRDGFRQSGLEVATSTGPNLSLFTPSSHTQCNLPWKHDNFLTSVCGGQRTTCRNWFSLSTSRSLGLNPVAIIPYLLSHLLSHPTDILLEDFEKQPLQRQEN